MATKKNGHTHPLTEADKQQILDLHAQGMSRNDIARQTGRSQPIVSRTVHNAGGTFDRSKTEAATKAALADRKKRRADIIDRLYAQTEKNLARLEADEFDALVPSGPGKQDPRRLQFVPAADARQLASALGTFLTQAANLEKVDADHGAAEATSMLGKLAMELGVTNESNQPEATGVPEGVNEEGKHPRRGDQVR